MDNDWTIIGLVAGSYTAITGAYGWLLKHTTKHLDKDDMIKLKENVVRKDTCAAVQEQQKERYETLLREIKLTQEMIRNNGHPKPRIQT